MGEWSSDPNRLEIEVTASEGGEVKRRDACPVFHGVEVFSATKARDREALSHTITSWLTKNSHCTVVDYNISQSSDSEFHCVTIALFYIGKAEVNQAAIKNRHR